MSWHSAKLAASVYVELQHKFESCENSPQLAHPPAYGAYMMAVDGASNALALDRDELRRALTTSSTKRRISELSGLQRQFDHDCEWHTPSFGCRLTDIFSNSTSIVRRPIFT